MSETKIANNLYKKPPIELLKEGAPFEFNHKKKHMETILGHYGIYVNVTNVFESYSVTRYEVTILPGTRLSEIYEMEDDLEYQLGNGPVRIERATTGDPIIGIEVPNGKFRYLPIRELIESTDFVSDISSSAIAIGTDKNRETVIADLNTISHLLIAGSAGSGKTMFINSLIISILYKSSPDDVQLVLIDPKGTEFDIYNGIPHLPIKVITQVRDASEILRWAVLEMERRYELFVNTETKSIEDYNRYIMNEKAKDHTSIEMNQENKELCKDFKKLQHVVIIIDCLTELMFSEPSEIEESICRLAQLSRAAGIHLIISTQMLSYNVLTGLIKANMPSRIAFAVPNAEDSITIIDQEGAEKLLGEGDMLFYPRGYSKPIRLQGAYVSDDEITSVVEYIKDSAHYETFDNPIAEDEVIKTLNKKIEETVTTSE